MINRNAELYYQSAVSLLLPAIRLDELDGFFIRLGKKYYYFRGGETPFNDSCSATIALNKYCTNKILALAKIPVPKITGIHFHEFVEGRLEERIEGFNFPLVIKPFDGSKGIGVICNIKDLEQLKTHLQDAFLNSKSLLIEEYHANLRSYRVLVFRRRVIGVILRFPAMVVGDGQHNIEQLIELTNVQRKKINDALGNIVVDEECQIRLQEMNLGLNYVPKEGEQVFLGYTSNATRGGSFVSLGKQICKENKRLVIKVADVLNLDLVGIDVECSDINSPMENTSGVIIEANHSPSIRIHELPMQGIPTAVTKTIVRSLIYRHPLAYLRVLYTNNRSRLFARSIILAILVGLLYKLFI